jgi:hypothetical protein
MAGKKSKAKKGKKSPTRKSTKTTKGKAAKKVAKSKAKKKIKRIALSRVHPEHGVFPDSPPIFAVDEADAEAAIGITRVRR